ncbi:hypothetical protein [Planococcus sp. SSTMD024]|uniref:hypothetical protein n=1 Tax=Planococcus sp. SSTMD024 TaxID=3242163 RepID=UPI00351F1001
MKKLITAIPLVSFAVLAVFVIKANFGDSETPALQEPEESAETEALAMSESNARNPKSTFQQLDYSEYDDLEHFITTVHDQWYAIHPEQRFAFSIHGGNLHLLAIVVRETNYWETVIEERELTHEFDRLQSTAFQISSPLSELHDQQKENELIHFQEQLDIIYKRITSES